MKLKAFCLIVCSVVLYGKLSVVTVIKPYEFLVKSIAKDRVNVISLVRANSTLEDQGPDMKTIKTISSADIFFNLNGLFTDQIVNKLYLGKVKVITLNAERLKDGNPHVWFSVAIIKKQLKQIYLSLVKYDFSNRSFYAKNYKTTLAKLNSIDNKIKNGSCKNRTFLDYHPFLSYFAKEYGFNEISVEENDKEPTIKRLQYLLGSFKKLKIEFIIVGPESDHKVVNYFKNVGLKTIRISALEYNLFKNYIKVYRAICE